MSANFIFDFKELRDENGRHIGGDPYHHLTIAGIAFEGVFCKYFLPAETIRVAPRPNKSNHSNKQIHWLKNEINKSGYYIHHARNGGEHLITLLTGQKVPVDGFCVETNTVYQFHGDFWPGCPEHYEVVKRHLTESRNTDLWMVKKT